MWNVTNYKPYHHTYPPLDGSIYKWQPRRLLLVFFRYHSDRYYKWLISLQLLSLISLARAAILVHTNDYHFPNVDLIIKKYLKLHLKPNSTRIAKAQWVRFTHPLPRVEPHLRHYFSVPPQHINEDCKNPQPSSFFEVIKYYLLSL